MNRRRDVVRTSRRGSWPALAAAFAIGGLVAATVGEAAGSPEGEFGVVADDGSARVVATEAGWRLETRDGTLLATGRAFRGPTDAHVLNGRRGVVFFDSRWTIEAASVVTLVDGRGTTLHDLALGDLFGERVLRCIDDAYAVRWSSDWWVDEEAGMVVIDWSCAPASLTPARHVPRGYLGVALADGTTVDVPEDVLRRRVLERRRRGLELFEDVRARGGREPEAWLREVEGADTLEFEVRLAAEAELRSRGLETERAIERTIDDPESPSRSVAVVFLGRADGAKALPRLAALVDGDDAGLARAARLGMREVGLRGETDALLRVRMRPGASRAVRSATSFGLGFTRDPAAVGPLLRSLQRSDGSEDVLLRAIGKLPGGVDALLDWAHDGERDHRILAAMQGRGDPDHVPLLDALARAGRTEPGPVGEQLALCGPAGTTAALDLLQERVGSPEAWLSALWAHPQDANTVAILEALDRGDLSGGTARFALARNLSIEQRALVVQRIRERHPAEAGLVLALETTRGSSEEERSLLEDVLARHASLDDPDLPQLVKAAIGTDTTGANEVLVPLLRHTDDQRLAEDLARLLAAAPPPGQAGAVIAALDRFHADPNCFLLAGRLARELLTPTDVGALARIARGSAPGMRCVAYAVHVDGAPPGLVGPLVEAAQAHGLGDGQAYVLDALAKADDPAALPILRAGLEVAPSGPARVAAQGLARLGEPGLDVLADALTEGTRSLKQVLGVLQDHWGPYTPRVEAAVLDLAARAERATQPRIARSARALHRQMLDRRRTP